MKFLQQLLPIILTVLTFFALSTVLFGFIYLLNLFPIADKIIPRIHVADVVVGLTIYLKTSVDFAIFIGNLMSKNLGIKNRIAIEIGSAFGNATGTFFVLLIWTFFKEVPLLMIAMIFLASLVLLEMAKNSLEEFVEVYKNPFLIYLQKSLKKTTLLFSPVLRFILPNTNTQSVGYKTFISLLLFSFTVPLILGLDDFAGYIPLFNVVNVFGFAVGVFLGHMILNVALFASPRITIRVVKQPFIALLGSLAFVGIALWGFVEIGKIIEQLTAH
ncbi:MAG TPA: hypothetical protein VEW42_02765 [Candidatus Eisenbacteria bacterium]|nr:hypothetical protein [Candidatus Eisenbacteria bacterium]